MTPAGRGGLSSRGSSDDLGAERPSSRADTVVRTDLSDEQPSSRADTLVLRESTGLQFNLELGPVKTSGSLTAQTLPASPSALATTTLMLAAGASIPAGMFILAGALLATSPTAVIVVAALTFVAVFTTGVVLVRHSKALQPILPAQRPPDNGDEGPAPSPHRTPHPGTRTAGSLPGRRRRG